MESSGRKKAAGYIAKLITSGMEHALLEIVNFSASAVVSLAVWALAMRGDVSVWSLLGVVVTHSVICVLILPWFRVFGDVKQIGLNKSQHTKWYASLLDLLIRPTLMYALAVINISAATETVNVLLLAGAQIVAVVVLGAWIYRPWLPSAEFSYDTMGIVGEIPEHQQKKGKHDTKPPVA